MAGLRRPSRIVSLLPAATEIAAALGAADELVAISHECDFPLEVGHLPRITTSPIDTEASSLAIDGAVRAALESGRPVIGVDSDALVAIAPDLILTQSQCAVCAVDGGDVKALAGALDPPPRVFSLSARDLDGVYRDVRRVGAALGRTRQAASLVESMRASLTRLRAGATPDSGDRPRVVCIEWSDPVFLAGHWVPELVWAAGGRDVGADAGAPSRRVTWEQVETLRPDVLLVMLCGFGVQRSQAEIDRVTHPVGRRMLDSLPTAVIDGNAFTSRPGPRLVEGAERMRRALDTCLS